MRYQELYETIDDDVIRKIHNNCMPFLKESNGKFLYRGLDILEHEVQPVIEMSPKEDRYPMNTPRELHDVVNDWFMKYGFKAHRGNSFFCTSSFGDADKYGVPHAVFPVGKFNYTWSPLIHDFFEDIDRTRITKDKSRNFNNLANNMVSREKIYEYIHSLEYMQSELPAAIKLQSEVMITCDSAFLVHYDLLEVLRDRL